MRFLNKRDTRFVAPTLSRSDPAPGGDRDTIPERSLPLRRCSGQALSAVEGRYQLRPPAARFTSTVSRKKRGSRVFFLPFPTLQTIMRLLRL